MLTGSDKNRGLMLYAWNRLIDSTKDLTVSDESNGLFKYHTC